MLTLEQIESYYPSELKAFKNNLLREYFQYKILEILFESPIGPKLCFMGGSCIRIVHGVTRFSEDLDFDNFGLTKDAFQKAGEWVKTRLEKEGYPVELQTLIQGKTFHYKIKIEQLLYQHGLSPYPAQKVFIKVDTEPQGYTHYQPERVLLNRFDVFTHILAMPVDILLSQKIVAIVKRKRSMGRDFYDASFLWAKTEPNYDFLNFKLGVSDRGVLKKMLLERCYSLDLTLLAKDVAPFVFETKQIERVIHFKDALEKHL